MSLLKRAKSWEISDSEVESDVETKAFNSDSVCSNRATHIRPTVGKNKNSHAVACVEIASTSTSIKTKEDAGQDPPASCAAAPSPGKRRHGNKGEAEAEKRTAEKKDIREKLKRKKTEEREEKKREQKRRKEVADRVKNYRPENCLKCLTVSVDPVLLQDEGSDTLLKALCSLEWKNSIEEQQLTKSITWKRVLPEKEYGHDTVEEEQTLMVLKLHEFMDMVISMKENHQHDLEELEHESVFRDLSQYLSRNTEKIVTLAVIGISSWDLWKGKQRGRTLGTGKGLGLFDMEEVLVSLQLCKNISVIFLESWKDLTDHVCAVTRALSKRPMRLLMEPPDLPFCVDGSWASGVRVERDGVGLGQVWSRQIQQLNRVSPPVAAAVSSAFPSPQLLMQAYKDLACKKAQKHLLADLPVTSGDKERRVGPDISCRVYRLLTAQNPQLVLD